MKGLVLVGILLMSSYAGAVEVHPPVSLRQTKQVTGNVLYQGKFYRVSITMRGQTAIAYRIIDQINYRLPQQGQAQSSATPLNSRSELAVDYHFTHYVTIPTYGRVYLRL